MSGLSDADLDALVPLSPPVAVSAVSILGVPLSEWVYVFTIAYTVVGIATIIKKHWIAPKTTDDCEEQHNDKKQE
jgi:uncharacterized membrane protein YuzA (DUF378 family)